MGASSSSDSSRRRPEGPPQSVREVANVAGAPPINSPSPEDAASSRAGKSPRDPSDPPGHPFVSSANARSGGGSKVRDEATGKYVFQTFRQQMQRQLQRGQPGSRHLSALDVMEIYTKAERRPWKRLKEETDDQEAEQSRKRIETEASDFARLVGHILQGVEARGPARQLLVHLSGYASSLPLLLLQREEVLQLLLEHLRREDTYGVVLQLLPALAKDLRQEFLGYLQSCIGALHLLLFDLEGRHDADGVQKLFHCLSQIFRYLQKYLVLNMEDFLDIMLPLLLHSAPPGASQKRKRPVAEEMEHQAPEDPIAIDLPTGQQEDQAEQQPPPKRKMCKVQRDEPVQRPAQRRPRSNPQKQRKDTAEVKVSGSALMAAQAVATVLRRAAREEEVFYDCISSITEYFLVVPSPWLPAFAACASRIFFESIRGLECAFTNSFEGVSCFLVANVLLRQQFTLPGSGATYEPPPLELNDCAEPSDDATASSSNNNSSSCCGISQASSRVCGRQVYLAHAECVRMYLDDARRHAASTESPAALALQRVTLRLLGAAVRSALAGQSQVEERQQMASVEQRREMGAEEMLCLFTSSFSPFFSLHPFLQLTSFPYFQGGSVRLPCRSTAEAPCSRCCLPPPVLVGCCTLADAAASWFACTPRNTGSFDAYIQKLLEVLQPFCVSASGASDAIKGAAPSDEEAQHRPPVVPPLIQPLLWSFTSSSDCVASAAVTVLLPCSLLRVIVFAWRALSVSYTKAVPLTGSPFQHLLPALLSVQRYQLQQLQLSQEKQLQPVDRAWWQGVVLERVLEVFLCSLRMLLLVPAPVDGFSSLCLRYAVEFLAGQHAAMSDELDQQLKAVCEADHRLSSGQQQVQQDFLLGDITSWRWATASSLLADILKTYGRKGKARGTGSTWATIRLLLPLHMETCLRGTCGELHRLETSLRDHIVNSRETEGGDTEAGSSDELEVCFASAFVGLRWLWELRKALAYENDVGGQTGIPTGPLELTAGASRAATQLQQQQQRLLCQILDALQHGQHAAGLRSALLLLFSRVFVTFLSLPRLVVCQEGEGTAACPEPPESLTQLCAERLSEAAAACSATAATNGKSSRISRCDCFGTACTEYRTVPSPADFEGIRRLLLSSSSSDSAGEVEAPESVAAASDLGPEGRWVRCLLSFVLSSSFTSTYTDPVRNVNAEGTTALLQTSPAIVKSLCLALRLLNTCGLSQGSLLQQRYHMRELCLVAVKALLPNLSSGSAHLRLWSLRFISSCEPASLFSCACCDAFACHSCPKQSLITPAVPANAVVRSLLQKLESLEKLKVDLDTERPKIQLLHSCAEEVRALQEMLAGAEQRKGAAAAGPECGGLVLLLQLAYRVLLAGLSVKFATVWPEVVDAVTTVVEAFQDFTPPRSTSTDNSAGSPEFTEKPLQTLPPDKEQRNAALAFVWKLVVSETHRALDQLGQEQQQEQQQETPPLHNLHGHEAAGSVANNCQDCILSVWKSAREDEVVSEETTPLQKHSHLLRILQRFGARWGSSAFLRTRHRQRQPRPDVYEDGATEATEPQQPSAVQGAMAWRRNFAQNALRFLLIYGQRIAIQLTRSPDSCKEIEDSEGAVARGKECGTGGLRRDGSIGGNSASGRGVRQHQTECKPLLATACLIPRAQDVLRAILAHGEMRFSGVGQRLLGFPCEDPTEENGIDAQSQELENLWQSFLEACTQRLIGVRDASLQALVLQTLMLCRELQQVVKPYFSVLEEALKDKGGAPSGLLRLVLGKDEAERQVVHPSPESKQDVVLLPEHRAFMLPLIVRLLISKTQVKMGRSPGVVLANRRRIFGLLGSLEETEIPMVLAVLALRLLRLTPHVSAADKSGEGVLQGGTPLEGMDKERALVSFIRWQHFRAQMLAGADSAVPVVGSERDDLAEPPVHVTLSDQLLGPSSSTQLHGLLKSLQHLVQMQQHTLRPAAPFLVFVFGAILQQLVPATPGDDAVYKEVQEMVTDEADKPDAEDQQAGRDPPNAEFTSELTMERRAETATAIAARHKKHCIRIAVDSLHQLFAAFPDFVEAWKVLLSPAAPALQLLLSAAVETGAAGYSGNAKGGGKCPAVVRFVASWASNADYFVLYEELLPKALSSIIGAIGSEPLLRFLQRTQRSTTPLLEVAIETALLLCFGGRTKEQLEEELRISQREFNAMKHVNERRRRRRGYYSSSSEESDEDLQEKDGFVETDKASSLKTFRETYEALQRQQELQQQRGLQVLLPHLNTLLHCMELLLNARRGAASRPQQAGQSPTQPPSASKDSAAPHMEDPVQLFMHRREKLLLVGLKELQLLTRLAAYACADKDLMVQSWSRSTTSPEEYTVPTTAKLIRLLLLSLPLRIRSGGAAARQQLTLAAIKGLLPSVASWRQSLSSRADPGIGMVELRGLLRGLYETCCSLLECAEDLQCRAAASEVLLATELAACGCVLTEEVLTTQIRGFALRELHAFRQAEEEGEGDLKTARAISWIIPGGALCDSLLKDALPSLLDDKGSATLLRRSELAAAWRVSVALVMVCANLLKAGSRGGPEEQRPDVDMQVLVLLAVVENHLRPPALARIAQCEFNEQADNTQVQHELLTADDKKEDGETATEMRGEPHDKLGVAGVQCAQESVGEEETPLQATTPAETSAPPLSNIPASAFEPIVQHVLYLLSDCSDDLTLQHVALTVIRKAAMSLGAAASAAATLRTAVQFADEQGMKLPSEEAVESDWGFAVAMQRLIMKAIFPHLHRLMRSMKEDCQRMALRALDSLVRTLGPAGPLLPPHGATTTDGEDSVSGLFLSDADQHQRFMRLHLDLYPLLTATQVTPAIQEAASLAQELVASGKPWRAAAAAARAAQLEALAGEQQASEREGGGDVLLELLHMQKHRRARGLQLLGRAVAAQKLCMNTVRHFCVPLALWAILQENVSREVPEKQKATKASSRQSRGRQEAFSQQMADQGVACLAQCCTRLPLKSCIQTLKQLVTFLAKVPQREAYIHRAIAATLKTFPFGLSDAVHQTVGRQSQLEQGEEKEDKDDTGGGANKPTDSSAQEPCQGEQPATGLPCQEGGDGVTSSEDESDGKEASKKRIAQMRKERVETCIRDELIPMLYPLAFGSKVRRVTSKGDTADASEKLLEQKTSKTYENPVVRTELVAVLALLARMLPPTEFHLQLPRLVRSVAFALRSRERTARRDARVALTRLTVNLGSPYFTYLVTEVQRTLGPKSEKNPEADQQSFLRPVLLFTLHAMLNALHQQQQQSASTELAALDASQEATSVDDTQFVQKFEAAVPLLLPLIAEEINRVADPDSLDQGESRRALAGQLDGNEGGGLSSSSVAKLTDVSTHSKVEEAQSLKGPSLLLLLTKDSSPECLRDQLLPFVLGLLTGASCKREGWSSSAAFSSKYVNRAEDLLLHFVFGLSRNNKISLEKKLRTAKQLLILTVATLQFPLLHPVLQAERGLNESLFLLSKQQLLLLGRKKRGKKPHTNSDTNEESQPGAESSKPAAVPTLEPESESPLPLDLSPSHKEDLQTLRLLLVPEAEDDGANTHGQTGAPPVSQRREGGASNSSRKLLVSLLTTSKDRRFTLQPGAITGRSLAQATRNKPDQGATGLELPTQSALLGTAALRLLHLSVKAAKTPLKTFREKQLGLASEQRPAKAVKEMHEVTLRGCMDQLDEVALGVVCCFSCRSTKLVSWGARCLLEMLAFRLPRLENRGALVAYLTMKIFHSCGGGSGIHGADHYTARSELLPICTKLLAVLLLQPQASKWMDTALNPSQHIGGDMLRSLLREQLRVLPWRYQDQLQQQRQQLQQQQQKRQQQGNGGAGVMSPQAELSFSASAAVTEEQLQAAGQFCLKEALLAHISSSLEDSQLQLCALFLFRRVVLQHYKELVGEAARRAVEESKQAAGELSSQALQRRAQKKRQRDAKAAEEGEGKPDKQQTAAAELLPLVYECVDRVARVMVQHATFSAVSQKLSTICADVYVSFLLNFPMTPRLQQRRVFFLFQQQKFSDLYGRRAAIAALHKVVRRFPAELFMERYGQVALLTCCSTLATETDQTAYGMLQQVVREVLQLVEVAEDPISRLQDQLKTVAKVFLVPRMQHLMALLEFLSVFVPLVGGWMAQKGGLAPFLPKVTQLLCAVSYVAAGDDAPIDWRLLYKVTLVFEELLAAGCLPWMEEAFGKAAQLFSDAGVEALYSLTADAANDAPEEAERTALERRGMQLFINSLNVWQPPPSSLPKDQKAAKPTNQNLQQRQQVFAGLHAAQLWNNILGIGLHHENAWVRSAALRCVAQYLQRTPAAAWRRANVPLLAFLVVGRKTRMPKGSPASATQPPPLTALGLALGQHFGRDSMLERHPSAAPCAIAALLHWAQIAYTFPHLVSVTCKQRRRTRAHRGTCGDPAKVKNCHEDAPEQQLEVAEGDFEMTEKEELPTQEGEWYSDVGVDATKAEAAGDFAASPPDGSDNNCVGGKDEKENSEDTAVPAQSTNAPGSASEGESGDDNSSQDEAEGGESSSDVDGEEVTADPTDGGEAEDSVLEEMQREASKDDKESFVAATQLATAALPLPQASWSVFSPERGCASTEEVSCRATTPMHPLVFLVSGLNRWLRIHLGRLGFSDSLQLSGGAPGTVARVSGIVAFFASLVKLLPLAELQHSTEKTQTRGAEAPSSGVVRTILEHIADAAYRCSTLHAELASDSVLAQLIEGEDLRTKESVAGSTRAGGGLQAREGSQRDLWDSLRSLRPVLQLGEVATGGTIVLRRMEQLLRNSGHEHVYRVLLAATRQSVSAKRVMRKLKAQQTFLENPQAHAQRKRRRNKAKELQRKTRMREAIFRRRGFVKRKRVAQ